MLRQHKKIRTAGLLLPSTRIKAILLFAIGYLVWQPLFQVILLLFGEPLPLRSLVEWRGFLIASASLGAIAGAIWFSARRMPATSWHRAWIESSVTMLALSVALNARFFGMDQLLGWLFTVLAGSAITGALWTPLFRWSARQDQARSAAYP